jgi:predicted nucleic acid-binding protein
MNVVFADTFYWIAFTNIQDLAHERVKDFTRSVRPDAICTTEEVLTEYLNYFAAWGPRFRRKAALNVENMLDNRTVRIVAQTADFRAGFELTARVGTRDTA